MSLTLPSNYENASKNSNIKENWLYQLFNNDSYLSFDGINDFVDLGATTTNSAAPHTPPKSIKIKKTLIIPGIKIAVLLRLISFESGGGSVARCVVNQILPQVTKIMERINPDASKTETQRTVTIGGAKTNMTSSTTLSKANAVLS